MGEQRSITFASPGVVELRERPAPALEPGKVMVEPTLTAISPGTELTLLADRGAGSVWKNISDYPLVPGYSGIGRVTEAGREVSDLVAGQLVAGRLCHASSCAVEPVELTVLPESELSVKLRSAAAYTTLAQIALNGVRRARVCLGEIVAVAGVGIVGHFAALFACAAGARRVVVSEPSAFRRSLLPDDPRIVAMPPDEAADLIRQVTGGIGADVAIEATGHPARIPELAAWVRTQGRVVILSSPRGQTTLDFHDLVNWTSISIIGAHNSSHPLEPAVGRRDVSAEARGIWTERRHRELYLDMLQTGAINTDRLVTRRVRPEEAPEVYRELLEGSTEDLGIVVDWTR